MRKQGIYSHHTPASIRCILLKGNCEKCNLSEEFKPSCKMRESVKRIIDNIGGPKMEEMQKIMPNLSKKEKEILDSLCEGKTKEEIYANSDTCPGTINTQIHSISCKFKEIINYDPSKSKIDQVVEFVKKLNIEKNIETIKESLPDSPGQPEIIKQAETKAEQQNIEIPLEHENIKISDKAGQETDDIHLPLTEREISVLNLIIEGKNNNEIAEKLFISVHTAKAHVCNILNKLGVSNRQEVITKALRLGILTDRKINDFNKTVDSAFLKLKNRYSKQIEDIATEIGMCVIKGEKTPDVQPKVIKIQEKLNMLNELEQELKEA